jgi:hypothetical protein
MGGHLPDHSSSQDSKLKHYQTVRWFFGEALT